MAKDKEKRTTMIMVRVTKEEKKRIEKKAKEDNRTVSNYLLNIGLNGKIDGEKEGN